MKKVLIGLATPEKIEEWKKHNKAVYELIIDDAICYLRKPTRQELSAATALSNNDPYLFNEQLLNSCWLGGAEIIKTDDEYFFAAGQPLAELLEVKQAELKKI